MRVTYQFDAAKEKARECPQDSEIQRIARAWAGLQRRNFYQVRGKVSANDRYMRTSVDAYRADDCDVIDEEYDYQNADAQVDESIRCNEYEFDGNGNRE